MDYLHGTEYPEPFFSIGENKNGMRATRGLILQVFAGLFVIYHLITKKSNLDIGGKIFFLFLFFLSFIMYKNALGRSDSYHIRMSNDLPILINSFFFIINFLIQKLEKNFDFKFISMNKIIISMFIILLLIFYDKINLNRMLNYPSEVKRLIALPNEHFIDNNKKQFVKKFKSLSSEDNCFQNFTDDLILLYLINKPSCTKFVASWLASPSYLQDEYIFSLKKSKPRYIVYESIYFKVDGVSMSKRLEKVNEYILENYEFYQDINSYKILRIKN